MNPTVQNISVITVQNNSKIYTLFIDDLYYML
jgi:hypothetical protein